MATHFQECVQRGLFDTWFSLIFFIYYFHLESRDVGSGKLYFYLRKAIFIPHNGKAFSLNVVDRKILLLMIYVKKQKLYKKNQPQNTNNMKIKYQKLLILNCSAQNFRR